MPLAPAADLQQAVFAALSADAELTTLLGGARVYDAVPENAEAPYLHLDDVTVRDWSTGTETGAEIILRVTVWSRAAGRLESLAIAGRVRALLHDQPLALTDHALVNLRHEATETTRETRPDGRRASLRFRAAVEPV